MQEGRPAVRPCVPWYKDQTKSHAIWKIIETQKKQRHQRPSQQVCRVCFVVEKFVIPVLLFGFIASAMGLTLTLYEVRKKKTDGDIQPLEGQPGGPIPEESFKEREDTEDFSSSEPLRLTHLRGSFRASTRSGKPAPAGPMKTTLKSEIYIKPSPESLKPAWWKKLVYIK